MREDSFRVFQTCLRNGSGLAVGREKTYLLEARLTPIARAAGLADLDALADRLRSGPAGRADRLERDVIEAMTTNESLFFRDEKPFNHVRTAALPALHAARPPGVRLRLWSAAASTGQEAYSLAMIVADLAGVLRDRPVGILGTDIAREQLARARRGSYTQFEVQRGLPVALLLRHFEKDAAGWRISPALRATVEFREQNLLHDLRPLGQFDIIFCRNVLLYFDNETKTRVLEALARQLAPDGYLYLGGAETALGLTGKLAPGGADRVPYQLTTPEARPISLAAVS